MHDSETQQHYTIEPGASDPQTASLLIVGVVGIILTAVTVIALEVVFYKAEAREFQRKVVDVAPEEYTRARAVQLEKLQGFRAIEGKPGRYAMPIEDAMKRIVELDRSRRTAAGKSSQ